MVTTAAVVGYALLARGNGGSAGTDLGLKGKPAPAIATTTLDGKPLDLAAYKGRPVVVNFWGPSCVPCRDEFPLFKAELAQHGPEGLAIVGVLMYDAPDPARKFMADLGADWPTVDDPTGSIRTAYGAIARPQTYFIGRDGVLREIQIGQVTQEIFDRFYAEIAGAAGVGPGATAPVRPA